MKRFSAKKIILFLCIIQVCITAYLFGMQDVTAEGFASKYKQMVFDQSTGLGSSEINCIYQTQSGYIWIGTDGGLYRYNGNEFKLFNLWNTDKADVYYINALFQDSQGRLWVATNNYGLFRIHGNEIKHFSDEYYSGLKIINDVCEDANGNIIIATAYGIYNYNPGSDSLIRNEYLAKHNIRRIVLAGEKVWGIYNGNTIFSIDKGGSIDSHSSSEFTKDEITTVSADEEGNVYIGTIGSDILVMKDFSNVDHLVSDRDGINKIRTFGDRTFICADSGVGYFKKNGEFVVIDDLYENNYISDMIMDYEGNYWFASSRYGVLYLSKSKFSNFSKDNGLAPDVTSCVDVIDGKTYIGSDNGLFIIDENGTAIDNELTQYMSGVSIRDIEADKHGNIWISTYRKYGVVEYTNSGQIKAYNRSNGLISNLINLAYPLSNGNIAVGTNDGICIMTSGGRVVKEYNYDNGLDYTNIISLYEDAEGKLYAGSDGGGLYIIDGNNIRNYTEDDGLNSNVISCITGGTDGLWIGTNNGMSYYDGTFRSISNIDFSNNIYSILMEDEKTYIVGSKGLLISNESELLGTAPLKDRYYSSGDGIDGMVTINSNSCVRTGIVYLCTDTGVYTFDSNNIEKNYESPKITVSEVDVDGKKYYFDQMGGELNIPNKAQRIEISFAVLSYSNRENISVVYQLVGFDKEAQSLSGNENLQAVYTNLEGGSYSFEVSASNGDGVQSQNKLSFIINKEYGFFEKRSVKIGLVVALICLMLSIAIIIFRMWSKSIKRNEEIESLVKKHEKAVKVNSAKNDYLANMSNEIKLPLNAMISSAGNLIREGVGDEDSQKDLRDIVETGNELLGKVDETILLARLESGAEEVVNEPYSVTTLMCDISDSMINRLEGKPVTFLVDLGENIPDILVGDFDKIKNVLDILLGNAIKYTKEGSITLAVDYYEYSTSEKPENEAKKLVFSVSDTGTGISEDRLEHIFEIYYVDESKKTSESTGNGISLSIAKKLAELMEGEIEAESKYGAGSAFTFSLKQKVVNANGSAIPLNDNTIERVSREEAERMWAPDARILVVDDVEISRNVSADVVSKMEIKCDTASSGLNAIDMVMNADYDLVMMDIAMPVMNGIDALKEIRSLSGESYQTVPVIAMSEDVIGKNRQELIDEGFSDVILKPFDITVLASVVSRFVASEKIKYKSNDVTEYLTESRYIDGLKKLEHYFDIPGILEKIGGNINVYNRILSSFYSQNKDVVDELKEKLDGDYRGFRNKIHSLRNGCQNIGAMEASEIVLRIENAISLGNKGYVRDNVSLVYDCLTVINETIEEYLQFVDSIDGISDVEYAEKHEVYSEEKPAAEESIVPEENSEMDETVEGIDSETFIVEINKLEEMKDLTYNEDLEAIKLIFADISDKKYGADDTEFISVLGASIEKGDFIEINDLLTTYISLKS